MTRRGTYRIVCTIHRPNIRMTVRVRSPAGRRLGGLAARLDPRPHSEVGPLSLSTGAAIAAGHRHRRGGALKVGQVVAPGDAADVERSQLPRGHDPLHAVDAPHPRAKVWRDVHARP